MRKRTELNLALQGGGAHGAFTWGVLDRLLEDETLDFGWIKFDAFDDKGALTKESLQKVLQQYIDAFAAFIDKQSR